MAQKITTQECKKAGFYDTRVKACFYMTNLN